ncbi:MAG: hypothetical protein JXA96_09190 [Sedimentisphaerales bacterium]|nr:hypothetical protein [Sedimentisphaerales bacterium]
MVESIEVKIVEDKFISRLQENFAECESGFRIQESDCLSELRKLTSAKLLRNELETKYPLGKSLSIRIIPKEERSGKWFKKTTAAQQNQIFLTGKVIIRLERFVEKGSDDEPLSLSELHSILTKETELANRNRYESILGLYSPTGWSQDATDFIQNDPPGSGWASNRIYPVLIGPEINELVWDTKSEKLSKYIQYFCGLTLEERSRICKNEIQRAILVQEFANIAKIAQSHGFELDFVKKIAKEIASGSKELVITKVSGVGLVLKKKI